MGCPSASDFAEMEESAREYEIYTKKVLKKFAPYILAVVKSLDIPVSYADLLLHLISEFKCGWDIPMRALEEAIYGKYRYLYTDIEGNLHAL